MKLSALTRPLAAALTFGLIAGCAQVDVPRAEISARPAYVMQVAVRPSDTPEGIAAKFGGQVYTFDASQGYAIVGFTSSQRDEAQRRVRALGTSDVPQPNINTFEASATMVAQGSVGIWSGGSVGIWSGGSVGIWSGGNFTPVPENSASFNQIELERAQSSLAKNLGAGVKVAVIDTGIDLTHSAFAYSLAPASEWKDFVDGDASPQEAGTRGNAGYGHGTAVAGIVLQIAPNATILPLRVLGPDGGGDALSVALAIDHAVAMNAQVINLSLGSPQNYEVVQLAVERATKAGRFVIASAGNDNRAAITYPAQLMSLKGLDAYGVSVGSINRFDTKSSFSNFMKDRLEIVAPGEGIYSTYPGTLQAAWSGTSMSAPIISGALALALGQNRTVKPEELVKNLLDKSDDVYANGQNSLYKDMLGKGRVDLQQFLASTISY
ncbi:S8 family peptidase [Deinococcus yavapaiensis]|uniref:Subtilase family protein n=1 Tax=Deinococcus yavapaiensis KR-236 TaxID=694435 RepID=A0A318S3X2_9DEIO|nr:S8 family serine peptidase [Deinococcus yavapaiensis]PYE51147.1 subtilase family protein [Deinococcus yavapaiensis KR-236]